MKESAPRKSFNVSSPKSYGEQEVPVLHKDSQDIPAALPSSNFVVGDIVQMRTVKGCNAEIASFHPKHVILAKCVWFDRRRKFHELYVSVNDLVLVSRPEKSTVAEKPLVVEIKKATEQNKSTKEN